MAGFLGSGAIGAVIRSRRQRATATPPADTGLGGGVTPGQKARPLPGVGPGKFIGGNKGLGLVGKFRPAIRAFRQAKNKKPGGY